MLSEPSSLSSLPATSTLLCVYGSYKSTTTSRRSPRPSTRSPRTTALVAAGSQRSRWMRRVRSNLRNYWMPRPTRLLLELNRIQGYCPTLLDRLRDLSEPSDLIKNTTASPFNQSIRKLPPKLVCLFVCLDSFCYVRVDAVVTPKVDHCSLHM